MALTTTPDFLEKQQRPAAVVTFDEQVREKVFVPDWADPRVIAYERKQELQHKKNATAKMEDEHSELRRLDHCYVQVLLKLQRQKGSSNTTATKQKKQKNPFADSTVWCPRGLEVHWDPTIGARKRKVRLQSTCHILHTQALQRQRADNEDNDETSQDQEMADAYRPYSEPCQAEAHRQGLLDELDAHCDVGHGVLQVLQEHRRRSRVDSDEDAVAAADDASSVTSYSSCSSRSSACSIRSNAMVRRGKGRRSERFSKLLEEPESLSSSNAFPTH